MLKNVFIGRRAKHEHPAVGEALHVQNLTVRFNGQPALDSLTISVESGLRVAVVGPNGAGKSTFFNALAGILVPTSGEVRIHGHAPAQYLCLAYVPQSSQLDWNFPASVQDVVLMGRVGLMGLFRFPARRDHEVVEESLQRVNLTHLAHRQVGELSGGQKQRMLIARALAQEADLVLLDEPLAGLDIPSQDQILSLLDELKQQGITVLFATHDLELAAEHFDRILLLNRKLIAYGTGDEVLTPQNLALAYGGHMQMIDTKEGKFMIGDPGGHHSHESEGRHG
jgi:ABC-type Mn2+/Zn2+ transport system ATPase subunit